MERNKQSVLWNVQYLVLLIAGTLNTTALFMSVPVLPQYMTGFGATYAITGLISGIGPLVSLVTRPLSGVLADRWHRKYLLMATSVLTGLTIAGYGVTQSIWILAVLRILNGIVFAVCNAALFSLASQTISLPRMGEGIGYISLTQILASALGPSLGLAVSEKFGAASCFLLSLLFSVLSVLILLPFRYEFRKTERKAGFRSIRLKDLLAVDLLPVSLMSGPFSLGNALVMTFLALLGTERAISNISVYFVINAAALILIRPLAGKLYDRKGLKPVLLPAFLADMAALALIAFSRSFWAIAVAAVLRAAGQGAGQPSIQAECIRMLGQERSGVATGTYYLGNDIFQSLGSMAGGAVLGALGHTALYLGGCAVSALFLLYYLVFQNRIFRAPEQSSASGGNPSV